MSVHEAGYPAKTFGIISGYRIPWYNKGVGNVPDSRLNQGGVGRYINNGRHGGFIHVDARGYFAHW